LTKVRQYSAVCGNNVPFSQLDSLSGGRKIKDQRREIRRREGELKNT
jgi:hypothetical protein